MSIIKNITNDCVQDTVVDEHEVVSINNSSTRISNIKKSGSYKYISTEVKGIYRIVTETDQADRYALTDDYLVSINKGRQLVRNKKTGMYEEKYTTSQMKVSGWKRALKEKGLSDMVREDAKGGKPQIRNATLGDVIGEFKKNEKYFLEQTESYQVHMNNHFNHILDFFENRPVKKIDTPEIEKYYVFEKKEGNRGGKNSGDDKKGICNNTLTKHKTTLSQLWEFMIEQKVYGIKENVVKYSQIPKDTVKINGCEKKVVRTKYHARSLNLEELLYTLNDAIQNEFDRSVALMIGCAALGAVRRGELCALTIGNFDTEFGLKKVSSESCDYGGFSKEFIEEHRELVVIDKQRIKVGSKEIVKLPKGDKIRVIGICEPLEKIIEYYLEQRKELDSMINKPISQDDWLYNPIVNEMKGKVINYQKAYDRWEEYQVRRNKRMIGEGLIPIPVIRYHDLRQTFANLQKIKSPGWEISYQMGHELPDKNTTTESYWNDREPYREDLINYFNDVIRIDWDKAMRKGLNDNGQVRINGSGHLVFESETEELFRRYGKKKYLTEEEETMLIAGTYAI